MADTTTHRAINLAGVTWIDNGRHAAFQAIHPGYGVEVVATGELLAKNGTCPSVWRLKLAAATIAEHAAELGWATVQRAPTCAFPGDQEHDHEMCHDVMDELG